MTYSIDLNILLYAVDTESPFYTRAAAFFPACLDNQDTCCLTWDVLYGFIRITTHPAIFKSPLPPETALANINALISHPRVETLGPNAESWKIFQRLAGEFPLRGNLVSDAVTASILEANGIKKIHSHDRDFWKFPYLKPMDPLTN
jgi:uncharacterized protein